MLQCQHSFCAHCCDCLAVRSVRGPDEQANALSVKSLVCPTCGVSTALPSGCIQELQTNATVVKMMDLLQLFCPDKPGMCSRETSALAKARREIEQQLLKLEVV